MGIKKTKAMGDPPLEEKYYIAQRWCLSNNIKISPLAVDQSRWTIVIENQGQEHKDPNIYTKKDIWKKLFDYYCYYYEKYRDRV